MTVLGSGEKYLRPQIKRIKRIYFFRFKIKDISGLSSITLPFFYNLLNPLNLRTSNSFPSSKIQDKSALSPTAPPFFYNLLNPLNLRTSNSFPFSKQPLSKAYNKRLP